MENQDKQLIRESLMAYVEGYPSQAKAAESLNGVSGATVSGILSGKDDKIADRMWRNIAAQVGVMCKKRSWQCVETAQFTEIKYALEDAQANQSVTWVIGAAGCGKSTTANLHVRADEQAYYLLCDEDMHKGDFIRELAQAIGVKSDGATLRAVFNRVVKVLFQMETPLLIFDEADKLGDNVMHYFINLYNRLEGQCGIVFLSTDYIRTRMMRGLRCNKKGYNELHSRIGRKFFEVDDTTANDVYAICTANGINDKKSINKIIGNAQEYDFDLRRVKKAIHSEKRAQA